MSEESNNFCAMTPLAYQDKQPAEDSNLVAHADLELRLLGEEEETIAGYMKVIRAFSGMEHSGGSASVAIPVLNDLLQYKNLTPLTDHPLEWNPVGRDLYQSVRNPEAFSLDKGLTYYLLSEGGTMSNPWPRRKSESHRDR